MRLSALTEASGAPAVLQCDALPGRGGEVTAWAGPWAQDVRWWEPAEIQSSRERFYPGRLPELLPAFLAGCAIDEPFERWN